MTQITVQPIEVEEIELTNDVAALTKSSYSLIISSQKEYITASDLLKKIKSRYKELDLQRKEITKPLDEAKDKIMILYKKPLNLLSEAETIIKRLMIGYTAEQDRIARTEQLHLQKIADAEAEKERKRLEARIERAEASGKEDKAEELTLQKEMIQTISVPVITPNIETPKGVSYRDKYYAEVIDFKLLPDEFKLPNMSALDKILQATKGAIQIPGVKINIEKILSSRG